MPFALRVGLIVSVLVVLRAAMAMATRDDTDARAEAILRQMTLEETIDLIGGVDGFYLLHQAEPLSSDPTATKN